VLPGGDGMEWKACGEGRERELTRALCWMLSGTKGWIASSCSSSMILDDVRSNW
jgi:hypothetical protein